MVDGAAAQWAFTVVFGLLAVYSAYRLAVDRRRPLLIVGHGLHLLMAVDMVAMAWPWWTAVPLGLQLIVFGFGMAWFLTLVVLQTRRRIPRRMVGSHGPWQQAGHAVMMAAMVWMVAAMIPTDTSPATNAAEVAGHAHDALPAWAVLSGVAMTAALLVTATVLIVEFITCARGAGRTWHGHTGDAGTGAVMSFGMAAMCWLMLAV